MANTLERTPVTYFADGQLPTGRGRGATSRRRRVGWSILGAAGVGALILGFAPSPYVIERPGPVIDTLGVVAVEQDGEQVEVPLISVPDETTYPTDGALRLLTVNVVGNRESRPDWFEVVAAWGDPSKAVVPLDTVYRPGETPEQSDQQSAIEMENSQKDAVAAALTELDYDLESTLTVEAFSPESPSEGILEAGDRLVEVNGQVPADVTELREIIAENGVDSPVSIEVVRSGVPRTLEVTPESSPAADGAPIIGISAATEYDFPFEVLIQLDRIGGPSAGMMFALGIIDKLTPGALTGGADVAGTGAIAVDGTVLPIGGIRQKLYGARDAGADFFLAPEANCDEVTGHVPDGVQVFAVGTLDDALAVLAALRADGDLAGLPSCPGP